MSFFGLFGPPDIHALIEKRDINGLVRALRHRKSSYERKDAAVALGKIGDAKSVDALIFALKDKDPHVRIEAARALGKIGDTNSINALLDVFKNEENDIFRIIAAEAIGKTGDVKARDLSIAALTPHLKSPEASTRNSAAEALDKIGWLPDNQGENYYRYFIAKQDWKKCIMIGSPCVEALIDTFQKDGHSWLSRDGEGKYFRVHDSCPTATKMKIAQVLGEIRDNRAVNPLVAFSNEHGQEDLIFKVLAKIGDSEAINALNKFLNEGNFSQKKYAAIALGYAVDFKSVRCSKCKKELVHLGEPTFSPFTSVLGSPSSIQAMDQWRGNVCTKCQLIFCPDCIEVGYPTPCPKCGTPTKPAQKVYLENLTKLSDYNKS